MRESAVQVAPTHRQEAGSGLYSRTYPSVNLTGGFTILVERVTRKQLLTGEGFATGEVFVQFVGGMKIRAESIEGMMIGLLLSDKLCSLTTFHPRRKADYLEVVHQCGPDHDDCDEEWNHVQSL